MVDTESESNLSTTHKKSSWKNWYLAFGGFTVAFILGFSMVIPIWGDKTGLDILGDIVGGVERQTSTLGDDPPPEPPLDSPAFDYWYAPANSFGISETRSVNWSTFKNLLQDEFHYIARYKLGDIWHDGNQYLTFNREWNDSGFWKLSPEVDVPVDIQGLEVTFWCNKTVLEYFEKDEYEIWFNISANATETYSLMFNWSDLKDISGLSFEKGVFEDKFFMKVSRGFTQSGVYVFDPNFGYESATQDLAGIQDTIWGFVASPANDGTADSITVSISGWGSGEQVKCGLYIWTGSDPSSFVDSTDERTSGGSTGFHTFVFSEPKPYLYSTNDYVICAYSDDSVVIRGTGTAGLTKGEGSTYPTWESPVSWDNTYTSFSFGIYCTYTEGAPPAENTAPASSGEAPTNGTDCRDYEAGGVDLFAIVTDFDGDDMNVSWSSNSSGSWVQFATNTSITNNTNITQHNYNFTTGGVTYYWNLTINDGEEGYSNNTYNFKICDNVTTWQTVDDTFNGDFTNTTIWRDVDTAFNGIFLNETNWQTIDNTYNGIFTNLTAWRTIDDAFNGVFTNLTQWKTISDSFNGEFINLTTKTWQTIDSSFNGVFINTTQWNTIDNTFNGQFTNETTKTWQTIDNTFNGIFTNTTIWRETDSTFNGQFINTTLWRTISNTYNGIFTNSTAWTTISDTFDGIFINTTVWQVVDNTFNGEFTNTSVAVNLPPFVYNPEPANGSTGISVDRNTFGFIIEDPEGDVFNYTVEHLCGDSGQDNQANGSKGTEFSECWSSGTTYRWYVNTTDGNTTNSSWFEFTTEYVWQIISDSFNGEFTNVTEWNTIEDTFNGLFTNNTQWTTISNTFNGQFTNQTIWRIVSSSFNGQFTNLTTKTWQTIDNTFNGVFTNLTIWRTVDNTFNGIFQNTTSWFTVDDTFNGQFINTTEITWQVIDNAFNGVFINATSWLDVDSTFNGIFTNSTAWTTISDTFDGIFTNTTVWQVVDGSFNGVFDNVSTRAWQTIDDTFNGIFTNATQWRTVDDTFNGVFTNTSVWRTVSDTFDGVFTNTSNHIPTWSSHSPGNGSTGVSLTPQVFVDIDDTDAPAGSLSVSFFISTDGDAYDFRQFSDGHDHDELVSWFPSGLINTTKYWWMVFIDDGFDNASYWFSFTTVVAVWKTVSDTFNGVFTNTTSWCTISDTYNGIFTNTSVWRIVDDTFNGVFDNVSIRTWQIVDDTFNGIFTNTSIWRTVSDTFNGIFTNTTQWTWQTVSDTFNGVFTNSTIFRTISDTFNGVFTNTTSWYTISDTYNGVFTNTSAWRTVSDTFDGIFSNTSTWRIVDDTFNGVFDNVSTRTWQIVSDTFNGIFTNATQWRTVDDTFNGIFDNTTVPITWQTIDSTFNGIFTNTSSWYTISSTFNGIFTNTSIHINIQITLENPPNGSSIPHIIPSIYFTINASDGSNMNYTIYWGENQYNLTTNISHGANIPNGTYYDSFSNATNYNTLYYWTVNATDGTIWVNETYSFKTRREGIILIGEGDGTNFLPFTLLLIIPFILLFFIRKKREEDKEE